MCYLKMCNYLKMWYSIICFYMIMCDWSIFFLNVYLIYLNGVDTCMLYKILIDAYWFLSNKGLYLNVNIICLWCMHA